MTKQDFVAAQDADAIIATMNEHIDRIHRLNCEYNALRRDTLEDPASGAQIQLEIADARLRAQVATEFGGIRTNEQQRADRLLELQQLDDNYRNLELSRHRILVQMDQNRADAEFCSNRFQAATQTLRLKRAVLNFLAEGD